MTLDLKTANNTLSGLRTYPVAVTTVHDGRTNGLISLSAGAASIVPEAPRMTISITKYNFTHDLLAGSGVFAMHMLAGEPDAIDASLALIMGLGGRSGRDGDKLEPFATRPGVTGAPVLLDALSFLEGRVLASLDADENTIFLADVVAAEKLRPGRPLDIGEAWAKLPSDWVDAYERDHEPQVEAARRCRGLA